MFKYFCFLSICLNTLIWGGAPVYVVGDKFNEEGNSIATLWITDTSGSFPKTVPLGILGERSEARAIASLSNQLFCVGIQKENGTDKATLWITDTSGSPPKLFFLPNPQSPQPPTKPLFSSATAITAFGTQLFCVGTVIDLNVDASRTALWRIDKSGSSSAPILIGPNNFLANSIDAIGNKLCVVGFHSSLRASLLITDVSGVTLKDTLLSQVTSSANCVKAFDGKLFCGGYDMIEAGIPLATLWITDSLGTVKKTTPLGKEGTFSQVHSITANNNKIFCAGEQADKSSTRAVLWITDTEGTLLDTKELDQETSIADGISAYNDKLFLVGNGGRNYEATLWSTNFLGNPIEPFSVDTFGEARGIYIPQEPQELKTFSQALNKFSPLRLQKGV